jgi:hypothetical protein
VPAKRKKKTRRKRGPAADAVCDMSLTATARSVRLRSRPPTAGRAAVGIHARRQAPAVKRGAPIPDEDPSPPVALDEPEHDDRDDT